jgi:hypothetical protein
LEKNFAEIEKGEDLVRVSLTEFKGRQYVEVRTYYMADDGEWKPTRKGITLAPELMRKVSAALNSALEELEGN